MSVMVIYRQLSGKRNSDVVIPITALRRKALQDVFVMPRARLTQSEMESPWLVLEVSEEGRPRILVSEWSEKRLVFTDDNHWGASFEPGEFVWCVMTPGDVIFVEATAPDETWLINFKRLAARHGLAYVRGASPGQGKA
jgi:hypothetical protein